MGGSFDKLEGLDSVYSRARLMDTSYKCSVDEVTIVLLNVQNLQHTNCQSSKNSRKQKLLAKNQISHTRIQTTKSTLVMMDTWGFQQRAEDIWQVNIASHDSLHLFNS